MSFQFSQPSSGNFFKPAEHQGHLILVVSVTEIGERFDQLAGRDKPFAVADIVDLDAAAPTLERGVTLSHPGICNKLTSAHRSGEMVLGRIGQVATEKGNPAWVLGPFSPGQDDARASAWLTANPLNSFGQPSAPAPQAVPVPAPVAPQPMPAPAPVPQAAPAPMPAPVVPQQQAPAPAPQPQAAPAGLPAGIDPANLTPEILALLQKIPQQ